MSKFVGFIIGAVEIGVGIVLGPAGTPLIVSGALMIASSAAALLLAPSVKNSRQAQSLTLQFGEVPRAVIFGETAACRALVE
jgi:hypothetical protein